MLSRLTRLTTMSSHVVGGLSHFWDGQTAPNVTKVSANDNRGIAHDHGFYCVDHRSNPLSISLLNEDPFFGAPASWEQRPDVWPDIASDRTVIKDEFVLEKKEVDLGGRFTPESGLPWYERFDAAPNFLDSAEHSTQWSQTGDFFAVAEAPFDNNDLQGISGSWPFTDNFDVNEPPICSEAAWGKIDLRLEDDPPSESSEDDFRSDSSSPLIPQSPSPEPCPPPRRENPRRKNLMDIMKETLVVPEAQTRRVKTRSKNVSPASYYASDPEIKSETPKVRGIVVKPYVDAATFRRRVMNRESARKYRAKKRKEKVQVKRFLLDMEKKNVDLKVSIVGLQKEIAHYKKLLETVDKKL